MIRAFIQARMSSQRFPGKVLAPFQGQPMINHIYDAAVSSLGSVAVTVATSDHPSDDPLACFCYDVGFDVCRGDLKNVYKRFQEAARERPCDWIVRLCADSPLLLPSVIRYAVDATDPQFELISNARTYPHGQRVEIIRTDALMAVDADHLWPQHQEHVTGRWYAAMATWPVCHLPLMRWFDHDNYCVDTVEDLHRLEEYR